MLNRHRTGFLGEPIVTSCRRNAQLFLSMKGKEYIDINFLTEDEDKHPT